MTGCLIVPFSWNLVQDAQSELCWDFMQYAFLAGAMIAVLAGIVSYLVILRKSAFAAHALGHVGFAGAAGAVILSLQPGFAWVLPVDGLFAFTTGAGTGIALLGKKASRRDVEIGTVLAFMLGLGVLFISLYNGYSSETYSILFGSVVGISPQDVEVTLISGVALLVALAFAFRPLLYSSLDEEGAEAKGMPTLFLGWIFMMLLAIAISIAVQIIGVLLIFALLVTPAAIAIRLSTRPARAVALSAGISLATVWVGLFIDFWTPWPPGFPICTLVFLAYLGVRTGQYVNAARLGGWVGLKRFPSRVARRLGGRPTDEPTPLDSEGAPSFIPPS